MQGTKRGRRSCRTSGGESDPRLCAPETCAAWAGRQSFYRRSLLGGWGEGDARDLTIGMGRGGPVEFGDLSGPPGPYAQGGEPLQIEKFINSASKNRARPAARSGGRLVRGFKAGRAPNGPDARRPAWFSSRKGGEGLPARASSKRATGEEGADKRWCVERDDGATPSASSGHRRLPGDLDPRRGCIFSGAGERDVGLSRGTPDGVPAPTGTRTWTRSRSEEGSS